MLERIQKGEEVLWGWQGGKLYTGDTGKLKAMRDGVKILGLEKFQDDMLRCEHVTAEEIQQAIAGLSFMVVCEHFLMVWGPEHDAGFSCGSCSG